MLARYMYTFIHHEGSKSTVKNKKLRKQKKQTDIQYIYNNGLYKKTHKKLISIA